MPGDDYRIVIRFQRFEQFDAQTRFAFFAEYIGAINSDTFFGFAPRRAQVKNITANTHFEEGEELYDVTYEIAFRLDGEPEEQNSWQPHFLNADVVQFASTFHQVNGVFRKSWVNIYDDHNNPVTEPWPLDNTGFKLVRSDPPSPDDLIYIEAEIYKELPFSALELP